MKNRQYSTRLIYDTRVLSILNLLPKRNDEKIFQHAFISAALILFVIICGVCALVVYQIFEPFLQSILWSILIGAFLFPLKDYVTLITQDYLYELDRNSNILIWNLICVLPLKVFDSSIELISQLSIRKWREFLFMIGFLPSIEFLQSGVIYHFITTIGYYYFVIFNKYIYIFDSLWIIFIILIYFFAVLTIYNSSLLIKYILNKIAVSIWFILFIYFSQYISIYYRFIAINIAGILVILGLVMNKNLKRSNYSTSNEKHNPIFRNSINIFRIIQVYFHNKSRLSTPSSSSSLTSTRYFIYLLWLFIAIHIYEFSWYLIPISIFIIMYKVLKYFLIHIYIYLKTQSHIKNFTQQIHNFLTIRRAVLIPKSLHIINYCLRKFDKKFNRILQDSVDYLISASIIIILFILIIFGSIILLIQIQHESVNMLKLTRNFVNETIIFEQILPDKEHVSHFMDTILTKFYLFGRNWITTQVAKIQPARIEPTCCLPLSVTSSESLYMHLNPLNQNSLSNKNLEEQVLDLWDRFYTYLTNTTTTITISHKNLSKIFYSSLDQNFKLSTLNFHLNDIYYLIHNNLDLLHSILDSIWSNITVILAILSTILSLVYTSGFVVFNFFLSFIVFITLLFYLLSYSNQSTYRPIVWINNILAIGDKSLGKTINDVITSVFIGSLKIATFYGLYTYVLHTVLGSNLIFLPAVIASICAVILKSYWAALPGCLELWLIQQRPFSAWILLIAQIIPVYIVDTAIYSEVKGGGHQYLTALAIAGGVYYRGIEGALFGPIILCCLLVGIRFYNETMSTTALSSNSAQSSSISIKHRFIRFLSFQPVMTKSDTD